MIVTADGSIENDSDGFWESCREFYATRKNAEFACSTAGGIYGMVRGQLYRKIIYPHFKGVHNNVVMMIFPYPNQKGHDSIKPASLVSLRG